ncbi:MAG: hypothetical protein ABI045_02600 [Flavobacteriales bacterium]
MKKIDIRIDDHIQYASYHNVLFGLYHRYQVQKYHFESDEILNHLRAYYRP